MRIEERGSGWWLGPSSFLDPPPSLLSRRSSFLRPTSSVLSPIDIDPQYCRFALHRLDAESGPLFGHAGIEYRKAEDLMVNATVTAVAEGMKSEDRGMRSKARKSSRYR